MLSFQCSLKHFVILFYVIFLYVSILRVFDGILIEASHPSEFASTSIQLEIKCLKFVLIFLNKKDNIVDIVKQNHTKHVFVSFFNPLKVRVNSKSKV